MLENIAFARKVRQVSAKIVVHGRHGCCLLGGVLFAGKGDAAAFLVEADFELGRIRLLQPDAAGV
jgi:hypothetical protein